jgi:heme exporter protein C
MPLYTILALAGGAAMAVTQWFIYSYAPLERSMGVVQKILYLHMPMAVWGMLSFLVVCIAGIAYLKKRSQSWDALGAAAAEIGVLLTTLTLLSGSIWARHSWGVWWMWDPRLTTALVMWFLYIGYLLIRGYEMPVERKSLVCAVYGIVAFVDVPLVFLSARLWRSIHPTVIASEGGGLDPKMRLALLAALLSFSLLWVALLGIRTRQIRQKERLALLEQDA